MRNDLNFTVVAEEKSYFKSNALFIVDLEKPIVISSLKNTTWKQFGSFPSSQNIFHISDHMFLLWNYMKLG